MAFFAGASNVTILGGSFVNNEVKGNITIDDHSRHTSYLNSNNKSTNNVINSHNDNSTRISGNHDKEMPSMPPRSAGYREEDHTQPPPQAPQRPRFSPPQIPSTGGTATNVDSFNMENTNINGVLNNNSRNYYRGGAPPDNRRQQDGEGLPSTSGPHGIDHFKAPVGPVQVPFLAAFPPQMGLAGPSVSVNGTDIQQLDQHMGQDFEKWLKSTISQTKSMAAGISSGNYDPQAAYSSSSRNVDGSDSMNTGMANLSLNDFQPQIPTYPSPPTSFSSDRPIGLKLTDQMGSSNPSSNLSPYNNVVQQGSHFNPSLVPHMNEPDMANPFPLPTETRPYGNNPNRPPPPASTSPFNFPQPFSGGSIYNNYYENINKDDHSVHRTNIDSFNEHNNTVRDSFNDNSFVDSTGKLSATESNKRRGIPDPNIPKETRKKRNSGVRTSPDPSNRMDDGHLSDETDEQIPTAEESTVDSSGKKKKAKKWGGPFFGRR